VEEMKAAGVSTNEGIMSHPDTFLFMCNFRSIMDNAEPGKVDELTRQISGFYTFSKMFEGLAQEIQDGTVKAPK